MPNTPTQWAAADVMVNGQDLDVPLMLQPGVAINGRVVFEGSQPTAADLQALSFALVPLGSGGQIQASGGGRVDAEGRFTFAGVVPDTYRFVTTWNAPAAQRQVVDQNVHRERPRSPRGAASRERERDGGLDGHVHGQADEPDRRLPGQRRSRGDRLLHPRLPNRPQALDARLSPHPHDPAGHRRRLQRQGPPAGRVPSSRRSRTWRRANGTIRRCSTSSSRRRPRSRCATAKRRRRISGLVG